jgi:hypothetical protein
MLWSYPDPPQPRHPERARTTDGPSDPLMSHPISRLPCAAGARHDGSRTQHEGDTMFVNESSGRWSGGGQVLAAVGILFGLAVAAPLLGLLMVPFAAASSIARAARG